MRRSAAACSASRVFPMPPGPTSVSSRQSRCSSRSASCASSVSRPISGVGGVCAARLVVDAPAGRRSAPPRAESAHTARSFLPPARRPAHRPGRAGRWRTAPAPRCAGRCSASTRISCRWLASRQGSSSRMAPGVLLRLHHTSPRRSWYVGQLGQRRDRAAVQLLAFEQRPLLEGRAVAQKELIEQAAAVQRRPPAAAAARRTYRSRDGDADAASQAASRSLKAATSRS